MVPAPARAYPRLGSGHQPPPSAFSVEGLEVCAAAGWPAIAVLVSAVEPDALFAPGPCVLLPPHASSRADTTKEIATLEIEVRMGGEATATSCVGVVTS